MNPGEEEITEKDVRKCSSCGEAVKGHDGRCGRFCTNVATLAEGGECLTDMHGDIEDSNTSETVSTSLKSAHPPENISKSEQELFIGKMDIFMEQLVGQVSKMTMAVSTIIQSQRVLEAKLDEHVTQPETRNNPLPDAANIGIASNSHISQCHSTNLPEKLVKQAKSGEFVNLSDFLINNYEATQEYEPVMNMYDGTISFKPKRSKSNVIDNILSWLKAWNIYEAILVTHNPSLYAGFAKYRQFIQSCDRKYRWSSVYAYDIRNRSNLAQIKSFDFHTIDTDLFVTTLDATAIKYDAKQCFRCKAYDHMIGECPFPEINSMEKTKKAETNKIISKWYHEGNEGCNNFQTGSCRYPQCKRAHVCRTCKGPEPEYKCSTCRQ